VLVDGYDVDDVTLHSLRRQLGIVPQESFLFAGSIGDNIQFANPDTSREDVLAACDAVGNPRDDRRAAERSRHAMPRAWRHALVGRAPAHRPRAGRSSPRPAC